MSEMTVRRWRRYGHDRLFVSLVDSGERVGFVDLVSGARTVEISCWADQFAAAADAWLQTSEFVLDTDASASESSLGMPSGGASRGATEEPPPCVATDEPAPAPAAARTAPPSKVPESVVSAAGGEGWRDLSTNQPGELVKAKAVELRTEAPVRTLLARVLGVHTDERAYRIGSRGEERVGRKLDGLPEGWHAVHSVPVGSGDSDIDHIVIGPAGIFTLNTKNHPRGNVWVAEKALLVNGQRTHYLRNSRHEAARASKLLTAGCGFDVAVQAVIVIVGAEITVKARCPDVRVLYREQLSRWLKSQPQVLAADRVDAIFEIARRDVTWRTSPASSA
ncbi:MAG: hypothetical protein JWM34_1011 [Ilumatobacteraceae bacterium]|nr:hypothetical protein [Ilumatobacteraceae bacterium]